MASDSGRNHLLMLADMAEVHAERWCWTFPALSRRYELMANKWRMANFYRFVRDGLYG